MQEAIDAISPLMGVGGLVAPFWALASVHLLMLSWRATADIFIGVLALLRGRMSGARGFEMILGALATGVFSSVALRVGFWFLIEIKGYGLRLLEPIIYLSVCGAVAQVLVGRLPSQLTASWDKAMTIVPPKPAVDSA
jgi:hypothetical protein